MDFTAYISTLLYTHNCVIIPGFGGFVCSYKPAQINPVSHVISPPSKAISFNVKLNSGDGLLATHISSVEGISYTSALEIVEAWATGANSILQRNDELNLNGIGTLLRNVEGGIQFTPSNTVNYLTSSYGLPAITAAPIIRGKEIEFTEKFVSETKVIAAPRQSWWRVAAIIILLLSITGTGFLMFTGVELKPLELNQASVLSCLSHFSRSETVDVKPIPVTTLATPAPVDTIATEPEASNAPVNNDSPVIKIKTEEPAPAVVAPALPQHRYYIIIGAFGEMANASAAKSRLLQKYNDEDILFEKRNTLTVIGYNAGNTLQEAQQKLTEAHTQNSSYWLLKK